MTFYPGWLAPIQYNSYDWKPPTKTMEAQSHLTSPDLARMRVEYSRKSLSEEDVLADPIRQFMNWLEEAISAKVNEPNAMTLATASRQGVPSARIVLLKGVEAGEFIFFTNYQSRKSEDLEANPRAALVFWWPELERQVRVEGTIRRSPETESDAYFHLRPPAARLGSAISEQSRPVTSRADLERLYQELLARYPNGEVPRPAHWGGYRVAAARVEFWQGRPSRLHDRIEYTLDARGQWSICRLAP